MVLSVHEPWLSLEGVDDRPVSVSTPELSVSCLLKVCRTGGRLVFIMGGLRDAEMPFPVGEL